MKKSMIFLAIIAFTMVHLNSNAQNQHPKISIDINLTEPAESFATTGSDLVIYLNYEVEEGQNFSLNLLNKGKLNPKFYLVVSESVEMPIADLQEFQKVRTLKANEELKFKVELDDGKKVKKWTITFTTKKQLIPNSNFAYVSAIRSIDGEKPEDEFFDAFFKFNLRFFQSDIFEFVNKISGGTLHNAFSMAAFEFNFSQNDTSSTSKLLQEAMISVNKLLIPWKKINNGIGDIKRTGFIGVGGKIFDNRIYLGGHFGIIEIGGGFFTSYFFAGYYHDPYSDRNPEIILDTDGNTSTRLFQNNVYAEFAVQAENSKIEILSHIRFKVGILYPFKGINENTDYKPTSTDIKHRIALQVPLGEVFKF